MAGSATLITDPSMNARLEARIVATSVHPGCGVSTPRAAAALVWSHGAGNIGRPSGRARTTYSTVTDFARFLGLSTSVPRMTAVWYASSCSGITWTTGD